MTTNTQPISTTTETPENAQNMATMVKIGTKALENGDLMGALDAFEKVVNQYPDRPEGHNNLGAMYSSLGELDKAEACFDRVLAVLPNNPDVHYNRAVMRSRQEKFDTAREDFLVVLKAHPKDADTLNNLGVMDFMQGHLPSARKYFRKALKAKPGYINALLNLVDVEQSAGRGAAAVALCENYLQNNTNIEVRRKLLELLSNGCRDALDKASRVAENLIGTGDENAETRMELGRLIQARTALSTVNL